MSTTMMRPLTISNRPPLIRSSAEIIAVLLNEMADLSSSMRKRSNQKRMYPYWKACRICSTIYAILDSTQWMKDRGYCSKPCGKVTLANQPHMKNQQHKRKGRVIVCAVCGNERYKPAAWLRRIEIPTCSRRCNGLLRGPALGKHGYKGHLGWTKEGRARAILSTTGPRNHAWKGGVTYFRKHGNYKPIKYVRCPIAFHAMARKDGYVMEHRLMVAQAIGRVLLRVEVVHHIDHNPQNNVLTNFQLFANNRDHKLYEARGYPAPLWPLLPLSTTEERFGAFKSQLELFSPAEMVKAS